jgi:predicted lipase
MTLKQAQKLYPDAIRMKCTHKKNAFTNAEFGQYAANSLQGVTLFVKAGITSSVAIVSKMAKEVK